MKIFIFAIAAIMFTANQSFAGDKPLFLCSNASRTLAITVDDVDSLAKDQIQTVELDGVTYEATVQVVQQMDLEYAADEFTGHEVARAKAYFVKVKIPHSWYTDYVLCQLYK